MKSSTQACIAYSTSVAECPCEDDETTECSHLSSLMDVEAERSSLPCGCNDLSLPVSWPGANHVTIRWVRDLAKVLNHASRHVPPEDLPTVLPPETVDGILFAAYKILHKEPNVVRVKPGFITKQLDGNVAMIDHSDVARIDINDLTTRAKETQKLKEDGEGTSERREGKAGNIGETARAERARQRGMRALANDATSTEEESASTQGAHPKSRHDARADDTDASARSRQGPCGVQESNTGGEEGAQKERVAQDVVVVGDVHGQLHDVLHLLELTGEPSDERFFVFNGDYVDRGAWGVETYLLLLSWKVRSSSGQVENHTWRRASCFRRR